MILISLSGFSQTSKMDSLINAKHKANREKVLSEQKILNKEIYKNMDSTKNMATESWSMVSNTAKKIGWKKTIQAYSDIFFPIAGVIILLLLWLRGKKS